MDDAYISFRYAKMLADGHGLVFNVEDGPVEGFTNLSWVVLNAIVIKIGGDPLLFSQWLGVLSLGLCLSIAVLVGLLADKWAGAVAFGLGILLIGLPDLVAIFGSGLETSFAALLTVLLACSLLRKPLSPPTTGGIAFLLVLTRPDGALFASAAAFVGLVATWRSTASARSRIAKAAVWSSVALVPVLLVAVARFTYFGELAPNTYYAKNADVASWAAGTEYVAAFSSSYPTVVGVAFAWLLAAVRRGLRLIDWFGLLSLGPYLLYVCKVGGDFMSYRFMFQIVPLVVLLAVQALAEVRLVVRLPVLALVLVGIWSSWGKQAVLEEKYGMQSVETMNSFVGPGREVGLALARHLPSDTRISTTLAGSIPYFSNLYAVDEWGLNDKTIARATPSIPIPERGRGHMKRASAAYLDAKGVNLELGHPVICSCQQLCDDPYPQVYLQLDSNRCLRMRYRTQTPELTRLFCQSPAFVVLHVDCENEPERTWLRSRSVDSAGSVGAIARWVDADLQAIVAAAHGPAFGKQAAFSGLPGQSLVHGNSGPVANSFHGGDLTKGWIAFDLPSGVAAVRLRVGGGRLPGILVGLATNGTLISWVGGDNSEILREATLSVPKRSEPIQLVLLDDEVGSWGHLLVSDIAWGFEE